MPRGTGDEEEFGDIMLPCGLFQDEVIDIMYRDLKPEDFDMLNKLDERVPKRNIVQRNLVESLPRIPACDSGCTECGVCLSEMEPNLRVVQLPCRHAFHTQCISKWLTQCKNTCPLCSKLIDPAQAVSRPSSSGSGRSAPEAASSGTGGGSAGPGVRETPLGSRSAAARSAMAW